MEVLGIYLHDSTGDDEFPTAMPDYDGTFRQETQTHNELLFHAIDHAVEESTFFYAIPIDAVHQICNGH